MKNKLPLWAHIALGIIIGFSLLALGWTMTVGYIAKKEVEAFNQQIKEINRQAKVKQALSQARRKAEIEAKARAKEQAKLYALAEQERKQKQQQLIAKRSYDFEKWYETNMPENCKPNYSSKELSTDFIECVNHKMRAKREFN